MIEKYDHYFQQITFILLFRGWGAFYLNFSQNICTMCRRCAPLCRKAVMTQSTDTDERTRLLVSRSAGTRQQTFFFVCGCDATFKTK